MSTDLISVVGFCIEAAKLSVAGGRLWHWVTECVNARVDQWLWDEPWAWANDSRYQGTQG